MKKIISLILIAILCLGVLTSCAQLGGVVDSIKDKLGMGDEQPAEGPSLDDAVSYLHKIYKDKKETTRTDFDVVAVVVIDGVKFPVTWTSDNANVVVRESTKTGYYTVDLPDVNAEEFSYTLTATISNADGETASKSYTFKVPTIDNSSVVSDFEEGKAYNIGFYQASLQENYYIIGQMNGYYMDTTKDINSAVNVYVEIVDGGYNVYCIYWGEKLYINMVISDTGYVNPSFDAEAKSVYTFNSTLKTLVCNINNSDYGFGVKTEPKDADKGTYYTTLGPVLLAKADSSYFITLSESTIPDQADHGLHTPEAIINAAYELEDGEFLKGTHTLTGIIKSIDTPYDSSYKNLTVTIVVGDMEDKPMTCYRLKGTNAENLGVGDEITVTGCIKNHKGTIEFDSGCTFKNWVDNSESGNEGGNQGGNEGGDGETSENAVLDLMGNANLVNGSAQQNVFAANGITFTNDKAASTSDLTVQTTYAQRAYAGSTIKIEYPGMTKIVITFDDYSPDGTKNYMSGMDGMVVEGATFSRNNDVLTITFAAATDVFQSTSLTSQVRIEKIEVFTGEVETPETPDDPKPETPAYTAPVAGQAYDLYMELPTGKVYFAGTLDAEKGTYLNTTADASAAVKIYFEEVTGGYNIYFMNGDVKTYINAEAYLKSNGYAGCHFTLGETATTVWTYDTTNGVLEVYGEIEGKSDTFFAGTYGTYSTVSLSGAYYKNQIASGTQFPARLELAEGGNQGGNTPVDPNPDTPEHTHSFVEGKCECGETDPNYQPPAGDDDGVMSIPEVLASASGTSVVVKGTVSEIYQSWNDQYSNISFYIKDDAGNKLLAYRCKGTKVVVGDVVTITGTTTVYSGTIQIAEGCTAVIDIKHVCSEFTTGSCTTDSYCVVCGQVSVAATGHNYVDGACDKCGAAEPQGDVLPGNLVFTSAANKADGDSYFKSNFPEWKITGKLGQTYGGYLGFGRSGDSKSSITSSTISVSSAFTVTTVLKGNGSSGVATSTLTFTLIDKDGNTIATGYADGSTTAAITPVDAKDTTYNISFTFVDGKTWTDVSNLVVSFSKATGNIGLKSLNFVQ